MLDTNLKKYRRIKNIIIVLVVMLPALLLVALYPKMEEAMLQKKEQWDAQWQAQMEAQNPETLEVVIEEAATEELQEPEEAEVPLTEATDGAITQWYLIDNFVNYAIESGYYQYAQLLQDASGQEVFTDVLEHYHWVDDYYEFTSVTPSYAVYKLENGNTFVSLNEVQGLSGLSANDYINLATGELTDIRHTQLIEEGVLGCLAIEYDAYGKLADVRIRILEDHMNTLVYDKNIYKRAKDSISQYETNANYYQYDAENASVEGREKEVCPKNFYAVYVIHKENERFVASNNMTEEETIGYIYTPYYEPHDYYFATGAYWIVAALAVLVALVALILPLFKKLETGWEKLFSWPFEIMCCVGTGAVLLGCGMCILMSWTTRAALTEMIVEQGEQVELLGYAFSVNQCYWMLLIVNFLGWALAFFLEYVTVAHTRQFLVRPVYYLKNRLLGMIFVRWIWRWWKRFWKRFWHYVTAFDLGKDVTRTILIAVLCNSILVFTLMICHWSGIIGVGVYALGSLLLLAVLAERIQAKYRNVLEAAHQMAEGNLHINLEEDLGPFESLGEELESVQQGFAKAVAEEAKSQNMKSELITNVSHDLKTPLTAIITYVDLLKNPEITEEERNSYIETLDLKSQRLKVLIEDLFEVSKANSGNVNMNFMDVDIVKLMKEVRVEMSDKIDESNLDFRWNLPEEKVVLSLDGQRTYRIFENLLNNAIKYAMPFTRVYVDMRNRESEVVITFKNMSAQELDFDAERLTDRFVRGDSSRNSEGSGLGLAIAKSFTELQNGRFDLSVDGDLFKVTITFLKN